MPLDPQLQQEFVAELGRISVAKVKKALRKKQDIELSKAEETNAPAVRSGAIHRAACFYKARKLIEEGEAEKCG